jgi:enoyl-CoA hydratase
MPDYENIKLSLDNHILTLTIDRPDSLNALNFQTVEDIRGAIGEALIDEQVKAIIITGSGEKAFVAGADINEIKELNEVNSRKIAENGQEVFGQIENSEKPVIAAVNGYALGGGCELAMACHIRVATENALFGQPEVKLGIIPGYGGTQRLTHLVGKGKAMELLMTGKMISAKEALDIGLVNYLVSKDELFNTVNGILSEILKQAPMAVANVVDCVNAVFDNEANGYQTEANNFMNCCRTEDFKEGTTAFLEKREPVFKGE